MKWIGASSVLRAAPPFPPRLAMMRRGVEKSTRLGTGSKYLGEFRHQEVMRLFGEERCRSRAPRVAL